MYDKECSVLLIGNGVWADPLYFSLQAAIDGIVIGGELGYGGLLRMDKGNVRGADISLDQQTILAGYQLH